MQLLIREFDISSSRSIRRFWRSTSGKIGLMLTVGLIAIALLAPILIPYELGRNLDVISRLQPPSAIHLLGTDGLGRDLLASILHGIRTSLIISLGSVGIGATIGLILGLIAGYFRGLIDTLVRWYTDILLAFPSILLAIVILTIATNPQLRVSFAGITLFAIRLNSLQTVMLAVGIVQIPIFIRLTRSLVLSLREQDYILAAKAIGATAPQIIVKHILPGSLAPIIVQASLSLGTATLEAAGLGFLGLGAQPPTLELGTMLADAFRGGYFLTSPWTTLFPGFAITLIVLAFNLLGDGLRDGFDPRSQ
ncbi:ABC transporter permease [Leptolyngbya sp. NIES-2104]|uniref:ABC transporter permease n=1 Tax=Leptolyngbya sp. NIES-2104 TaxID=1552121 RepID=UPI0006EC73A0|nr:ABC transporter permease [Leptolyngbya sp. NIES-2104]GAP99385.1 dipeptide transport system permease protein DppC [Leptolyngbya sp. NIES-2104]